MPDLMAAILAASVPAGRVAVWWLGQSGYTLKTPGGLIAHIDPYLSDSRSDGGRHERLFPPPIAPADLRGEVVFCTHDHPDHTDPATLLPVVEHTSMTIVAPGTSCEHLERLGVPAERLRRLDVGDRHEVGDLRVEASFALHGGGGPPDRQPRRPVPDPIGLLVACGPARFYHTGDTLYDERLLAAAAFRPQTVFACINGHGGNMNAEEAARLVAAVGATVAIPMHYGCLPVNNAAPEPFVEAVRATRATARVTLLKVGQRHDLQPSPGEVAFLSP